MKIITKTIGDELEIKKYYVEKGFTVIVEVFKVSEGFNSIAYNTIPQHGELEGFGAHTNKAKSVEIAISNLWKDVKNFKE